MKILSLKDAEEFLPVTSQTLLTWSKDPSSPFYSSFCKMGKKICVNLDQLREIAYRENARRVRG